MPLLKITIQRPRALLDYYGVVKDMIELDYYRGHKVMLFDCDWIDGRVRDRYKKTDEDGFVLVNFKRLLPGPDTYTLAFYVNQLFYVMDPTQPDWHVAVRTKPRDLFDMGNITTDDIASPQNLERLLVDDEDVHEPYVQFLSSVPDDDEFMSMMNMGSAVNDNTRRLEQTSSISTDESEQGVNVNDSTRSPEQTPPISIDELEQGVNVNDNTRSPEQTPPNSTNESE
ncbi:hypothetical protein ACLB2K_006305 [Fragaria x ananassa]